MMNDEQRMIFEMLKAGEISAEEAERLMDALAHNAPGAQNAPGTSAAQMPARLRVRVTERGRQKVNIKVPFAVVRLALKLGKGLNGLIATFGGPDGEKIADALREVDLDEILREIGDGEIPLPCTLVDVDVDVEGDIVHINGKSMEGNVNVQIVLE